MFEDQITSKACTKCGASKPLAEFSRRSSKKNGLQHRCKSCVCVAAAAWYAANPEKARAANAARRSANPEKARAAHAAWYAANHKKVRAASAAWRAANPEAVRAASAAWSAANPEAKRTHNQNRRARKLAAGGQLPQGLAEKLLKLQRGTCACGCKQLLGDDYHLDHIMPLALGGSNTDDNIQLLRSRCNQQKNASHPVDFMQRRGWLL